MNRAAPHLPTSSPAGPPPLFPSRSAFGRWWDRHQARIAPALFLAPAVCLFAVFVIYPILASLWLSFQDWDGIGPKSWAGLSNYRELLRDPVFHRAVRNNFVWLLGYFAAPALGLALALFLNQTVAGIRLARALFFVPFVMSQVVVGLVFGWFFNAELGLFGEIAARLGLGRAAPLGSENWAIVTVIVAGLWPQTAYCAILYLAGLTALKPELVDAARVDGARGLTLFRHVVLPQLRPVSFIVAMVCIVSALRGFDLVAIMTAGGPYDSSTVLAYYMYEQTFLAFRYGYAAAIAVVMFVLMGCGVGFFLWRLLRREARGQA